jgi:hypothetical protein
VTSTEADADSEGVEDRTDPPTAPDERWMMYLKLRTEEFPCMGELCGPDEGAKEGRQDGDAAQGPGGAAY